MTTHVTVAICNYNYARFLGQSIDSALRQDYPHLKVLVIDDGSTDDSRAVIESYGSRVVAVYKENGGQGSAYNRAIDLLDTDYALMLDADDVLYPSAVSEAVQVLEGGDYSKAQFRLDVIDANGQQTGAYVPHSEPAHDCGKHLLKGWLYPSPPASGHVYRVSALKSIFPLPDAGINRFGADFYAIYGAALQGGVATIPRSLGGYRVHQHDNNEVKFANSESYEGFPAMFDARWTMLRNIADARLGVTLPSACYDFALEKARFCSKVYGASFSSRWRWALLDSGTYLYTVIANPFWSGKKKLGTLVLSSLCLLPFSRLSDFAVRYIVNPVARRRVARS